MGIRTLAREIETLRAEMIRVAEYKGCLHDPQVIELSQRLDQLLVRMQRLYEGREDALIARPK
ncbi:MAG TPA: aspartyl-phosphate phosphatase Spo0E family protein [Bacilli bacterium]|nr:aspartyl-phosphate phosphatase Spo0E family protein [Bacilli bacterium]